MKAPENEISDIVLAITEAGARRKIKDYYFFVEKKDVSSIADMIFGRLHGRYLRPFMSGCKKCKGYKNGFAIMANCCLLIETLVSFKNGWDDSRGKEEKAFVQFFGESKGFDGLEKLGGPFYKNVRCGILHQGETVHGWKIRRIGALFDTRTKTINANEFSRQLGNSLTDYIKELKGGEWNSEVWKRCRKKMSRIIENCKI